MLWMKIKERDLREASLVELIVNILMLYLRKQLVTKIDGRSERVEVKYEGFWEQKYIFGKSQMTVGAEPIDTHKNFCEFGGDLVNPQNGAQFNEDGTFKAFKIYHNNQLNDFAGVKSYLEPRIQVEIICQYSYLNMHDLTHIGRVRIPERTTSGQSFNSLARGGANWLVTSVTWRGVGKGCEVRKVYTMSGKNGWDKDIYKR